VEAEPTETVASALFVVEAAEDLQVTCGSRSNSGTTIAKPTKFPAGPCTVAARIHGTTLATTVDVRERRGSSASRRMARSSASRGDSRAKVE
jgi:hypothetical protein